MLLSSEEDLSGKKGLSAFGSEAIAGPLLHQLLVAQRKEAETVAFPSLVDIARALVGCARDLDAIVWPVGAAAERVAGAGSAVSEGALTVALWNQRLDGQRVLLFAVSGVTTLSLATAEAQVRSLGATEIHACGVDVTSTGEDGPWTSFTQLRPVASWSPPATLRQAS